MEKRITRLLDWTARDKAWFLCLLSGPLHLFYASWIWASLHYTDFGARFIDPAYAVWGWFYALSVAAYWLLLAAWGKLLRWRERQSGLFVNVVVFSFGVVQLPLGYLVGLAEPMTGVILLGASITGFVLFSFWRVLAAFFVSLGGLVVLSVLSVNGVLAYAPMLREDPISGDYVSPYYVSSQFLLGVPFVTASFVICYMLLTRWQRREAQAQRLATTDGLTGVANRRAALEMLEHEYARSLRGQDELAVVMLDLDHFKAINDRYGHAGGDAVLRHAASVLRRVVREVDGVGRLGGEEFVVVLPGASAAVAAEVAERCRVALAQTVVEHAGESLRVTGSMGVCGLPAGSVQHATRLLELADRALYQAKEAGRNRVICYRDGA